MHEMSSREDILSRIRRGVRRTPENAATASAEIQAHLDAPHPGPRPPEDEDVIGRFAMKALGMASTVDHVTRWEQAPGACARYLAGLDLKPRAVVWPLVAELDWRAAGIDVEARGARGEDLVGITGVFCAVAETGSLVLCSDADAPASVSLLPETHIALVPASSVLRGMEEVWSALRARTGAEAMPRAVNFVSGPSRTGDIEQTLVLGAHGPYRVHIVLIREA